MIRRERIPLLHDRHSHTGLYAAMGACPDLSRLGRDDALALLRSLPPDRLSVVRGWRTNELDLDGAILSTLPPVLVANFSLHGYAISGAGLPFVEAAAPELAAHRDDSAWREANVPRIFRAYCELAGLDEAALAAHFDDLERCGVGSAEDMAVSSPDTLAVMRRSRFADRIVYWAAYGLYPELSAGERAACSGVKLFLDGSLGARTAAIRGSWIGGGASTLCMTDGELDAALWTIAGWKTGVSIHAIGGLAMDQALSALERVVAGGGSFPVVRLEHLQFIDMAQASRARDLGAVLSMQPNFSSDTVDYADRLPASMLAANNPFRMLIDRAGFTPGRDLVFGSDGMPHGIEYAARVSLFPASPGQALSLEELVAGYGPALGGAPGWSTLEMDDERLSVRRIPGQ